MKKTKINQDVLLKYLSTITPTGDENRNDSESNGILWDYITKMQSNEVDDEDRLNLEGSSIGNFYFTYTSKDKLTESKPIVLDAHSDEISWRVNTIESNGLMTVIRNGGSDEMIAPSKEAVIITENGTLITGVFGFPAIHTRKGETPNVKTEQLLFDVNADDKEEVLEMGINVGDIICYNNPARINRGKVIGRALDNKVGGFIMASVIKNLYENRVRLTNDVIFVNAVQEEIGLYGARTASQKLTPESAIVVDVCHDTSTHGISTAVQGDVKIGKGIAIGKSATINKELFNTAIEVSKELGYDVQRNALGAYTGTNTDEYAYSNGGTPALLISIPLRYMHTTVETASLNDIEEAVEIIYNLLIEKYGV